MLTYCPAPQSGPPRVAYAVGRRAGGAVERNRIRRRLRPIVLDHAQRLRPNCQYLVAAGPDALHASSTELTDAWLSLLDRAHGDHRP
ncbi:MAG: ribonuclease protein component [Actinomycetota bacterium]|jgi:ribonuclease P protein component|nr:ribonuclease protein component [Actinomycetota bacterium]